MRALRRLYARWLVRRGKAVDIESSGAYPANVLSNLCGNKFEIDGFQCGSMEGFLQALKFSDKQTQHQVCQMKGIRAKRKSSNAWQARQQLYWNGTAIDRGSEAFQQLIRRAYRALFEQNERFRNALLLTRDKRLLHSIGKTNPRETILTEQEFCQILTELRNQADTTHEDPSVWICYRQRCPFRIFRK